MRPFLSVVAILFTAHAHADEVCGQLNEMPLKPPSVMAPGMGNPMIFLLKDRMGRASYRVTPATEQLVSQLDHLAQAPGEICIEGSVQSQSSPEAGQLPGEVEVSFLVTSAYAR